MKDTMREINGDNYQLNCSPNKMVVKRTTMSQFLVVLIHSLVVEDM